MPSPDRIRALRAAGWGLAGLAALAGIAFLSAPDGPSPGAATPPPAPSHKVAVAPPPTEPPPRAPFSAAGARERHAQRALWQQRLARAEEALEAYRESTRYPHDSQPLDPRSDQANPNAPIVEERRLEAAGEPAGGPVLQTSQERVFVQGGESVRFTLALRGQDGRALPLRVLRASAREATEPGRASLYPELPLDFNDDGRAGDAQAGDGVHGVELRPQAQGFAGLSGPIRVEAVLRLGDRESRTYFDLLFTDRPPATWRDGVREAMEDGSLVFGLHADVQEAGRYVVSARVVDAHGRPFALLGFNEEVAAGAQEFRLVLFGRLVRDVKPAFPVALRDVTAFLLQEEGFPDRRLLPRRDGTVHVSQDHPLEAFGEAEWSSEERSRYLDELGRDVARARAEVERLGP